MTPIFRAWSQEDKAMFNTGFFVSPHNGVACSLKYIGKESEGYYRNDDLILMQSTGLKDKNGKEIFEGDILRYVSSVCPECRHESTEYAGDTYQVSWQQRPMCGFEAHNSDQNDIDRNWIDPDIWDKSMEIIGNIHENPELIKQSVDKEHPYLLEG